MGAKFAEMAREGKVCGGGAWGKGVGAEGFTWTTLPCFIRYANATSPVAPC